MGQDVRDLAALLDQAQIIPNPCDLVAGVAGGDQVAALVHQLHGLRVATVERLEVVARRPVLASHDLGRLMVARLGDCGLETALLVHDAVQLLGDFVIVHAGSFLVSGFGHFFAGFVGGALRSDLRGLVGGPRHHGHLQKAHAPAVGDALLVGLVLDGHEADAERVQSAVAQQGHHVPAALRVADMRRDVQAVRLRFRVCDAADKLPVLVAELGRFRFLEDAIGVERLGPVPCADNAVVGYGHALQRAAIAIPGGSQAHAP